MVLAIEMRNTITFEIVILIIKAELLRRGVAMKDIREIEEAEMEGIGARMRKKRRERNGAKGKGDQRTPIRIEKNVVKGKRKVLTAKTKVEIEREPSIEIGLKPKKTTRAQRGKRAIEQTNAVKISAVEVVQYPELGVAEVTPSRRKRLKVILHESSHKENGKKKQNVKFLWK